MHTHNGLPNTPEQKRVYFAQLGAHYGRHGQLIRAAVLVVESWLVESEEPPSAFRMRPSRHPGRQEALVLIGRDAPDTRSTQVIQPFTRDPRNKPVWSKPITAIYDEPATPGNRTQGLLDELFQANQPVVREG